MGYFDVGVIEEVKIGKGDTVRQIARNLAVRGIQVNIVVPAADRLMTEIEINHPNVTVKSFPKER